ncbi:MAG: hypothetical protein BGO70_16820 [Bacteroidetes bacterium 43-93]|nr:hypothetical protein [Bacteroidota bacterium]OJX01419.1 MAG: hypothetical protein BGO70_16820 [Bacteroidetes bacterium 43-93]
MRYTQKILLYILAVCIYFVSNQYADVNSYSSLPFFYKSAKAHLSTRTHSINKSRDLQQYVKIRIKHCEGQRIPLQFIAAPQVVFPEQRMKFSLKDSFVDNYSISSFFLRGPPVLA